MSDKSGIEWTDATWNPTTGCDRVSPGCDNCYAMTLAKRLKAMGSPRYQADGNPATSGPGFGFTMHPEALDQPLHWTRPRRIFVNSMSDLFHGSMTADFLADVFAVMSMATQHTFQVLTKRPGVMRAVLTNPMFKLQVNAARMQRGVSVLPDSRRDDGTYAWPLPNVWLGTSVEDQKRADLRVPLLLETPAAVRFLSCEPLLGPVVLRCPCGTCKDPNYQLDWIIVGGESGPRARPMHPEWARSLRDQAARTGTAFHFKQWGEWRYAQEFDDPAAERRALSEGWWEKWPNVSAHSVWPDGTHSNTAVPSPGITATMQRVGKKGAGRELDGRTWDEFPQAVKP